MPPMSNVSCCWWCVMCCCSTSAIYPDAFSRHRQSIANKMLLSGSHCQHSVTAFDFYPYALRRRPAPFVTQTPLAPNASPFRTEAVCVTQGSSSHAKPEVCTRSAQGTWPENTALVLTRWRQHASQRKSPLLYRQFMNMMCRYSDIDAHVLAQAMSLQL